jgi:hypothetical protein
LHFNPYYEPKRADRILHERGRENKIRWTMGERSQQLKRDRDYETQSASRASVTLPTLNWMKPHEP